MLNNTVTMASQASASLSTKKEAEESCPVYWGQSEDSRVGDKSVS